MRTIRRNVFETNSSSTHSIAISKEKIGDVSGRNVEFNGGGWGWGFGCETNTASYLYTAIAKHCPNNDVLCNIERLKSALDRLGVKYEFEPIELYESEYSDYYNYYIFTNRNKDGDGYDGCGIDHGYELATMIEALLSDDDLLKRYLFGDSCIYTGNDNTDDNNNMCFCAIPTTDEYDSNTKRWREVPNLNHDENKYDYFYKGN